MKPGLWCEFCGDRVFYYKSDKAAFCECGEVCVGENYSVGRNEIEWDAELDSQGWNVNMKVCSGTTLMNKPCNVITWNEGSLCRLPHGGV